MHITAKLVILKQQLKENRRQSSKKAKAEYLLSVA